MASTINDIGVPGQPLKTPPLTGWQAAVRDMLNRHDAGDVWTAWTPTITGGTVSASDCRYRRSPGGLLTIDAHLTIATVTGTFKLSLPVAGAPGKSYGPCALEDLNTASYMGIGRITGVDLGIYGMAANGIWQVLSPTFPFTWTAGDGIHATFSYRVAPLP